MEENFSGHSPVGRDDRGGRHAKALASRLKQAAVF